MNIVSKILDAILPYHCIGCGARGEPICVACIKKLLPAEKHASPWITGCFSYKDNTTRDIIQHLKKYPNRPLIKIIANEAYGELQAILSEKILFGSYQSPILVPIPIHRSRFASRGYNQSDYIAEALCKKLKEDIEDVEVIRLLVKTKKTKKQALITRKEERLTSPLGSFQVPKQALASLRSRDVILIDDVSTTGATFAAAKVALLKAGARRVIGFALAH
jgi:ComF family protein